MTGFGSLYYTDCRPGQGLQGGAGFQFQAASPGVAEEAMALVARAALYEPPASWMREHRPVADYPGSLAHAVDDDLVVTAAGRYLGKEANGSREGNQFTHAVVTRDPSTYGLVRPAQLWGAAWWAGAPAAGTELELLPARPEPGPLDTETVRNRVREHPGGEEQLVSLLSAVHALGGAGNRRAIILVSADAETAVCWIAAATLLLPWRTALRTSFKVFVADPQYNRHDIIAVHPEWAGHWSDTGAGTGVVVFDLDRGVHSPVDATDEARFWAPRFLAEDAYDIVDAVELAAQFTGSDGRVPPGRAERVVALVTGTGASLRSPEDVQAAADWLRTAPEDAVRIGREPVLEAVLAAQPAAPVLRTLADAAGSRGWACVTDINRGVLAAELVEITTEPDGRVALHDLLGHPALRHDGRPAAEPEREHDREALEQALRAARPPRWPALLALAHRHKVLVRPERIAAERPAFARWWVTCDDPAFSPERWQTPDAVGWVREELGSMLRGDAVEAHAAGEAVSRRWWKVLLPGAADLSDPVHVEVLHSAYSHLRAADRIAVVRKVVAAAVRDPRPRTDPATLTWQVLFRGARPSLADAEAVVEALHGGAAALSQEVADSLCGVLDVSEPFTAVSESMIAHIERSGRSLSRLQRAQQIEQHRLDEFLRDLAADLGTPTKLANRWSSLDEQLLRKRSSAVVDALLRAPAKRAVAVVHRVDRDRVVLVYKELEARWRKDRRADDHPARAAAFTFLLASSEPVDEQQRADFAVLKAKLGHAVAAMSKEDRARVQKVVGPDAKWAEWVASVEPKWYSWRPRAGRHSGKGG